ncbi:MAG TPA: GerMN domain-containing protein [Spirochaetota bacterium]|nr:GerMN domain-containing protein [Spirochaetota bacterium]
MAKSTKGTQKSSAAKGRGTTKKGKAAAAPKAPAARKAPPLGDSGGRALYVLAILVLLTIAVLLVDRLYFKPGTPTEKDRPTPRQEIADADKKEASKTADVEKEADEKKDKKETVREDKKHSPGETLAPTREVRLYFLRFNEKTEKVGLAYARRTIRSDVPLLGAMQELAKGPSRKEEQAGMLSALPGGLMVRSVVIRNRVAHIDFNEALERNAVGSILMNRIDQIVFTATQFEGVDGVVIRINGAERKTIGPDGLALASPLTRAQH